MSWNKDDLQRQMDEHTASIEKFTIAPNAMQNIPQNLRPDLLARMDYLLGGITGDMQEGEYAYVKRCPIKGIDISDDQIKTLNKYYRRTYNKMSRIVLDCANQENEDWRKLVKILVNSEIYFRKQLSDSQLQHI